MHFNTFKVANVSTAHVTQSDGALMRPPVAHGCVMANAHGALFVVNHDEADFLADREEWADDGFSAAFVSVLTQARADSCDFVWFDADGGLYAELPSYNW